jgi:hypothetical protein
MPFSTPLEDRNQSLPKRMSVAVIMERRESNSPWADEVWRAAGVIGDTAPSTTDGLSQSAPAVRVINEQHGVQQLLYPGFTITLHADECESYYHNLMSPQPGCYVITRSNSDEVPIPNKVTLSFDEANAYLECEGEAFSVPLPAELYRWTEEFVLQHYMPEKRVKRKRRDWRKETLESGSGKHE